MATPKKKEKKKHVKPDPGFHWKVTFYINLAATYPAGWSETYHLDAVGYDSAVLIAKNLWTLRAASLCNDCKLVYAFVSDEGIKGDSKVVTFLDDTTRYGSYSTEFKTLPPWNVTLLREESGALYRSVRPIRGIPENEALATGFPSAPYAAVLNAVAGFLILHAVNRVFVKDDDKSGAGEYRGITATSLLRFSERRDGRPFGLRHGSFRKQGGSSVLAGK